MWPEWQFEQSLNKNQLKALNGSGAKDSGMCPSTVLFEPRLTHPANDRKKEVWGKSSMCAVQWTTSSVLTYVPKTPIEPKISIPRTATIRRTKQLSTK